MLGPPPSPPLNIWCLRVIMGESQDSGRGLGLDASPNLAGVKNDLLGKSRERLLEPISGLIMGDSESFPYQPKLRHWYEASYYRTRGGVSAEKFDRWSLTKQ